MSKMKEFLMDMEMMEMEMEEMGFGMEIPTEQEMEEMAQEHDCANCSHFDGSVCVNVLSSNFGSEDIIEDCEVFEGGDF